MNRFFVFVFLFPCFVFCQVEPFKVVLDAGHGGKDPGKVQGKVYEKDIVLKIVRLVGSSLASDPLFKVIYTRFDDTFVELYERGAIANKAKADLFVSIHCNASSNVLAQGVECYVLGLSSSDANLEVCRAENEVITFEDNYKKNYSQYDISSAEIYIGLSIMQEEYLNQSIHIASSIQNAFSSELKRKERGVKQAGFIVLHQTYMPAVLVEIGFMTNEQELEYLTSSLGQQEIASAIVSAIKKYRTFIKKYDVKVLDYQKKVEANNKKSVVAKEISEKKEQVENISTPLPSSKPSSLTYRVQIASSSRSLELVPENFKGLSNIYKEPYNSLFRYFYQLPTSSFSQAKQYQQQAIKKGFKDAFIVPYLNGERTTMDKIN